MIKKVISKGSSMSYTLMLCVIAGFVTGLICEGHLFESQRNFLIWLSMTTAAAIIGLALDNLNK